MRALITGISGFAGQHLAEHLLDAHPEVEIVGLRRWRSSLPPTLASSPAIRVVDGDLLDAPSLARAVNASEPDVVFHLAASSSVAGSWDAPAEMVQVNVLGTLHLLEAVRQVRPGATVVLACSAEAYGVVADDALPIAEEQPFHPVSPYAVSKAAADLLGYQYFRAFGVPTIRLRLFNHCGPRQSSRFVVASLARQVAEIEAGVRTAEIRVGDLGVRRDFVDVRDAARAYWLAATRGAAGEAYNVACGRARSVREVLDALVDLAGGSPAVVTEADRLRPAELRTLEGDASRFRAATGWQPEVPFNRTLADTLDYWRAALRG